MFETSVPVVGRRPAAPPIADTTLAQEIVDAAIARYFVKLRGRIPAFVESNFSLMGAVELHSRGFGHDLWRSPLNAAMLAPDLAMKGVAKGLKWAGRRETARWLDTRSFFLKTDVARELEWRLFADLLRLPFRDGGRATLDDALAQEIFADPRLATALECLNGPWGEAARARMAEKLDGDMARYLDNRLAAIELANIATTTALGAVALHQFTPGFLTLGPALGDKIVAMMAASQGSLAGTLHAMVPADPGIGVALGGTGIAFLVVAMASAVSGMVTDPVQKWLGLHHWRLLKLSDSLERGFRGDDEARFVARDQYAGRVFEVMDVALSVWRHARF